MLQAAIAVLHTDDPLDWRQIAALYGELARRTGSPVVELNQAAAIAESGHVEAALAMVEALELDGYHYLHSTRAELLRRLGRIVGTRAPPMSARSSSSPPTPNGASSNAGLGSYRDERANRAEAGRVRSSRR